MSQPFAFYSFGVSINAEQSRDIMSEAYPRALQGQVTRALFEKSIVEMELKSIRKLINKFKATEE